jgi:hypothetical protein
VVFPEREYKTVDINVHIVVYERNSNVTLINSSMATVVSLPPKE